MGPPAKSSASEKHSAHVARPRRGSLPELKSADKDKASAAAAEKKAPTGPKANPLYKTRLCMNFQASGSCPYGDKCQFAHGITELEKWESWRTSHKPDEEKKESEDDASPMLRPEALVRSRSQSEDTPVAHSAASLADELNVSKLLDWSLNSPIKDSHLLNTPGRDPTAPVSSERSNFSYWSSLFVDDLDPSMTPERRPILIPERRSSLTSERDRSSTYDNISQLSDAPTLFAFPPIQPTRRD